MAARDRPVSPHSRAAVASETSRGAVVSEQPARLLDDAWSDRELLRSAFDEAATAMSIASLNWRSLRVNRAHAELLGYSEHELLTTDFRTRIHPDDIAPNNDLRDALFAGRIDAYPTERRYIHRDGRIVHCIVTVSLIRDEDGAPQYFVGQTQDITERKGAEDALRRSEQRMTLVLASASDRMVIAGPNGRVATVNPAAERMLGTPAAQLIGRLPAELPWRERRHDNTAQRSGPTLARALRRGEAVKHVEVIVERGDGATAYGLVYLAPLTGSDGRSEGLLLTIHDVTERIAMERELARLALHDPLTELPNRRLFEDRTEQALSAARRSGRGVAVLAIDLDEFKPVNDRFGHQAGDRALIEIARRLAATVRHEDTVARLGGDEFAILVRGVGSASDVDDVRERVAAALAEPHAVAGEVVEISASIGAHVTMTAIECPEQLLEVADREMYRHKRAAERLAGAVGSRERRE